MKFDDGVTIRRAQPDDTDTLVDFNRAIARETEGIELRRDVLSEGIAKILSDQALGFYTVAEHGGEIVGSLMITTEWSDWRNGVFWW